MTSPTVDTIDLDLSESRSEMSALEKCSSDRFGAPHRDIMRRSRSAALPWISRSAAGDVKQRLGLEVWQ
jgi:hypothetical protein